MNDLAEFKKDTDVIVVNGIADSISDAANKTYSRNLFGKGQQQPCAE